MKLLRLLFLLLLTTPIWADYHPDTNWLSIKTEHFNILYDERIGNDAQNIANKLENYYLSITEGMGGKIDRYTLVLPAEMIDSNGYVSSINNKSVFYPTPPVESFGGTTTWYDLLTYHETRHMTQYSHIRNSIGQHILEFLFGSYGYVSAILIPTYFYEGDAVLTETLLSNSGRGRSPGFERGLRTILLSDENYSFAKAFHGSDKDYYPNAYVLGYYLMTYLQRENGHDILEDIANATGNNSFPMNFSTASLLITGESMPTVYKKVTDELRTLWTEQDKKITPSRISLITEISSGYINMTYPKMDEENRLFYLEEGLNFDSRLVVVDKTGVENLIDLDNEFSVSGSNIIYSVINTDSRWTYRGYSDIYRYNLDDKKEIKLTKNTRYFNPVYSSSGNRIAAIESSIDRVTSLVLLNSTDGSLIYKKEFPEYDMISGLSWSENDGQIIFSAISEKGNSLVLFDIDTGEYKSVSSIDNIEKSHGIFYKDYILFVSSYSGIDNINAINLNTGIEYQVLSSRYGADYPTIYGNQLIFSDYTVDGYKINGFSLNESTWKEISLVEQDHVDFFEPLLANVVEPKEEIVEYEPKVYKPNNHLIDVHSWLINPLLPVLDKSEVYDSSRDDYLDVSELVLFSNDNLEYLDSTFYTHYNNKTNAWDLGGYGTYRGLYPILLWDINLYSDELESGLSSVSTALNIMFYLSFIDSSFSVGIIPDSYFTLDTEDESTLDLTYYLSYGLVDNGLSFNPTIRFTQGLINSSSLSLGLSAEVIFSGFLESDSLTIYSELLWELNKDYTLLGSQISKPQNSLLSFDTISDSFISYNNIEYNIPLFHPDISIFNWVYFSDVDIYAGYESLYSESTDYYQLVSSRLSLSYYLLRMPLKFSTDFSLYYDITDSNWDYDFTILNFSYEDL